MFQSVYIRSLDQPQSYKNGDTTFSLQIRKSELIQKNGYLHTSYIIQLLNGHNMQITTVLHLHIVYVQYIHVFSFSNHILRQIIW